jgi:hypothetical protein
MYYKLNGREIEKTDAMSENISLFRDKIGEASISTVFLSLDHGVSRFFGGEGLPVLFETMIFGGEHGDYQERYSTYDEAEEGHRKAVEMVDRVSIERQRKLNKLGI